MVGDNGVVLCLRCESERMIATGKLFVGEMKVPGYLNMETPSYPEGVY